MPSSLVKVGVCLSAILLGAVACGTTDMPEGQPGSEAMAIGWGRPVVRVYSAADVTTVYGQGFSASGPVTLTVKYVWPHEVTTREFHLMAQPGFGSLFGQFSARISANCQPWIEVSALDVLSHRTSNTVGLHPGCLQ